MLTDLLELLSQHCETVSERRALLRETLGARSPLLSAIVYEGSAHEFVVNMLTALAHEPDTLNTLLDVVKERLSPTKSAELEALRPTLHEWVNAGAALTTLQPPTLRAETTKPLLISYSRRDREAVLKLYADLQALGFTLWRDLHDIQGGEPFWEEIKKGIDGCESVVLCMSPASLNSQFVQMEWHYARQQGKRVVPVVVEDVDFAAVPRWMSRLDWKDFREGKSERETIWGSFIRTLNTPYTGRKVPFMTPTLPPYFVERPTEFENLVNALVDNQGAVAITAAVKGAGGFGKTTLAMALCHDPRIRGAFDDGILWVTLGEKPSEADLLKKTLDLVYELTGTRPPVESREAAKSELAKAIENRYILLVLDDLWRKADVDIFQTNAKNSAILITTRLDAQLPEQTRFKQNVDAMRLEQAVKLLVWNIQVDTTSHQASLEVLAQRLGEWAVLLRLVNATLRKRHQNGETLAKALDYANTALTRKGLNAFSSSDPQSRNEAVSSTLKVSLDLLTMAQQARFVRLAMFPEDVDVPFTTLATLWGLDDFDTEETAVALNDAGLLLNFELSERTLRLHDVVRQYLVDEYRTELQQWQSQFIAALGDLYALPDTYCWRNLAYHLREANQLDKLRGLLLEYHWLQAKLDATDIEALMADCEYLPAEVIIQLVRSALALSAPVVTAVKSMLAAQLVGRLMSLRQQHAALHFLTETIVAQAPGIYPANLDIHATVLEQAGGTLLYILAGHEYHIAGMTELADKRILSWGDTTPRLWNTNGQALATLTGHTAPVRDVLVLADGRFLSSVWENWNYKLSDSVDRALRLWSATGEPLASLVGHTAAVNGVTVLANGQLLSWSADHTLRLWDAQGTSCMILSGHTGSVSGVVILTKDRFLSWAEDTAPRLWNVDGELLATLKGHKKVVRGVLVLPNGYLLSWSGNELRLWSADGALLALLAEHTHSVDGVLVLSDGRWLSWSKDRTLRLWNSVGQALATLTGHRGYIQGALELLDGRILSWSTDKTLRLWASDGIPLKVLKGTHKYVLNGVRQLPSGQFLSWSYDGLRLRATDGTLLMSHPSSLDGLLELADGRFLSWNGHDNSIRLWSADFSLLGELPHDGVSGVLELADGQILSKGRNTLRLWRLSQKETIAEDGHSDRVRGALALPDGRLVSWAFNDPTLRLWSWRGDLLATMDGYTDGVQAVCLLTDGRVLSWAEKHKNLWLWHPAEQVPLKLKGHRLPVRGARVLRDGCILSWSNDHTLRLWDHQGAPLAVFSGHTYWVSEGMELHDGRILSRSSDQTLRLWTTDGSPLAVLTGHTAFVAGMLELADRRFLSWSYDYTLRLWATDGSPLAVLTGHTAYVEGALELADRRLLSWSYDHTLRLWTTDGSPLAVLTGHTAYVEGAWELADGRILSWSKNHSLHLWDMQGNLVELLNYDAERPSLFLWANKHGIDPNKILTEIFDEPRFGNYRLQRNLHWLSVYSALDGHTVAQWVGDSAIYKMCWLSDAIIAVGNEAGRVLFLRFNLGEEALL